MKRKQFLRDLAALWKNDKITGFDLDLESLLDDAATLGLPGAARLYVYLLNVRSGPLTKNGTRGIH